MSTGMQDFVILTGIIIKAEPIGEYDRRVVLLTKREGKFQPLPGLLGSPATG